MAQDKFDVGGMTCAACQAHVDRAVSKLDGVQSVAVNLLAGSMLVDYDPAQVSPDDICTAVDRAGYSASPVSTGRGRVCCAHGELPVPAPATAFLLQGIPTQPGPAAVTGELCTPTGAALLAQFAASFGPRPALAEAACGCGFGTKRFPLPNCVRAWLGYAPR